MIRRALLPALGLASAGRAAVRPVTVSGGRVVPNAGEVQAAWSDPVQAAAHYVVLFPGVPGYPGFTSRAAVLATFGPPARVYRVGRYTIWYWPANLLGRLRAAVRNGPARAGPATALVRAGGRSCRSPRAAPASAPTPRR
jgi:hypothetical protein